jgi:hypothetical protein
MRGCCWPPRGREKPWTEIMLWATPKGPPRALQASECRELLNPTRASCLILAQRQPGKLSTAQIRHVPSQLAHNTGVAVADSRLPLGCDPAKNWLLFALARPYHGNL